MALQASRRQAAPSLTTAKARLAILSILLVIFVLLVSTPVSHHTPLRWLDLSLSQQENFTPQQLRIAKVSMLYGDNELYQRAIESHDEHNRRWNYPFHVLRHDIAGGYWNKPAYLLQLLITELAKPEQDRLEWLMWVDADLILINPSIPLHAFLPPRDAFTSAHYIGNKDHNGLNTGTFFLRVHPWSVKMLLKTMAFPLIHPDTDLHYSVDQEAMKLIFKADSPDDDNSPEVGTSHGELVYQPRPWYNTYEFHHGYEGEPGNLLVHFPGLEEDRWPHMDDWLRRLQTEPEKWDRPLSDTKYPNDIDDFWKSLQESLAVSRAADRVLADPALSALDSRNLTETLAKLRDHVRFNADLVADTRDLTAQLKLLLPTDTPTTDLS